MAHVGHLALIQVQYDAILLSFFHMQRQLTSFTLLTYLVTVLRATPSNMVVLRTNWKFIF